MVARASALLRDDPLLTPLLVLYMAAVLLMSSFALGPLVLVNLAATGRG